MLNKKQKAARIYDSLCYRVRQEKKLGNGRNCLVQVVNIRNGNESQTKAIDVSLREKS